MEKALKIKNRSDCIDADEKDVLKSFREDFIIPPDSIYMMGLCLGLCPKKAIDTASRVICEEWGKGGIESWTKADWFTSSQRVGNKLGKLIGAGDDETILGESTSVSIYKCLAASIAIQKIDNPHRRVIVLERENFPTVNYIAEGLLKLISSEGYEFRFFDAENPIEKVVNEETVVVLISLVNYRTGKLHNMNAINQLVHQYKAHVLWDLCHATGALSIDLNGTNADFATGCTYKYLNCGPGGPSFVWVNKKHINRVSQPITGWFGHANPFKLEPNYEPAKGITRFLTGTPPVILTALVDCSLDIFLKTDMKLLRKKSLQLSDTFIDLMDAKCLQLKLVTPRAHEKRGSHVAYQHENAYSISKLLREKRLICDFRYPDIIRFAITPLYLRFVDIWDAVELIVYAVEHAENIILNDILGVC